MIIVPGTGNTLCEHGKMAEAEEKGFGGSPAPVADLVRQKESAEADRGGIEHGHGDKEGV